MLTVGLRLGLFQQMPDCPGNYHAGARQVTLLTLRRPEYGADIFTLTGFLAQVELHQIPPSAQLTFSDLLQLRHQTSEVSIGQVRRIR